MFVKNSNVTPFEEGDSHFINEMREKQEEEMEKMVEKKLKKVGWKMKKVFCPHCRQEMESHGIRLYKCNNCGFSTIFCSCGARMVEKRWNGHQLGNFICRQCEKTAKTDWTNQVFFGD